jgi:REP element-mobilizing transposase RayT
MRQARIRGEGLSYYHCLSRVVDRRFIFGNEEREFIVALMRKLEAFLGVRVVTYAVMSNHFHLLVEVADRERLPPLDRDTLLRRLGFLYDRFTVEAVREELDRAATTGNGVWEAQILARYRFRGTGTRTPRGRTPGGQVSFPKRDSRGHVSFSKISPCQ